MRKYCNIFDSTKSISFEYMRRTGHFVHRWPFYKLRNRAPARAPTRALRLRACAEPLLADLITYITIPSMRSERT